MPADNQYPNTPSQSEPWAGAGCPDRVRPTAAAEDTGPSGLA